MVKSAQDAAAVAPAAHATQWELDPSHGKVTFTVKHMMVATARGLLAW